MEQDRYFPGRSVVVLPVKDALRGTRAILKRASRALIAGDDEGPMPVEVGRRLMAGFADHVRERAFEIATLLKLDHPNRQGPISGLSHVTDKEKAAAAFARTYRQGMLFAFNRMGVDAYLISETLAAAAYWSGLRKVTQDDPTALFAAHLYRSLTRHHVAGIAPGTPLLLDDFDESKTRLATFATLLWLLIDRAEPQDNEDEILGLCVDVVISLEAEIQANENDPQTLARLLTSYAEVI